MRAYISLLIAAVAVVAACADVQTNEQPTRACSQASCAGICVDGVCKNSCEQIACDDGNPCTEDLCDSETGDCQFAPEPDDTVCSDGAGACVEGECVDLMRCADVECDDGNDCTTEVCDPADGECVSTAVANDETCDFEGLPGLCKDGVCEDAMLCIDVDCSDGDLCTNDECDPSTGSCSNPDLECDDANLCTSDFCDPSVGCFFDEKSCADGNVCTDDNCDPSTGDCSNPNKRNGTDCQSTANCDPGVICIPIDGSCVLGACIVCSSNGSCSDLNPCTFDTCSGGRCSYSNAPNGTSCTVAGGASGSCLSGRCLAIINPPF